MNRAAPLLPARLRRVPAPGRLLVFAGVSGCGKTTALEALLTSPAGGPRQPCTRVDGAPVCWRGVAPTTRYVVVDELTSARDLPALARLMRRGHHIMAACHLPAWQIHPLRAFGQVEYRRLDGDAERIRRCLAARDVAFSSAALDEFMRSYRASFVMLDIILEHAPGLTLDGALMKFTRTRRIRAELIPRPTRVVRAELAARPVY